MLVTIIWLIGFLFTAGFSEALKRSKGKGALEFFELVGLVCYWPAVLGNVLFHVLEEWKEGDEDVELDQGGAGEEPEASSRG